jgi:hypothetical protein
VRYSHPHRGHSDRAIASYREALALFRQRGGHHESAQVLNGPRAGRDTRWARRNGGAGRRPM